MTGILQRLISLSFLLCPTVLYALGLGDIHLKSALNEPLVAEIELLSVAADELHSVHAGLASRETFTRYGIEQPASLSNLEFNVARTTQGHDVLRVTSRQAMSEPFLTFLVEVNWSRGHLLREYTLLLDPPLYLSKDNSANEQNAGAGEKSSVPVEAPQAGASAGARSGVVERPQSNEPAAASSAPLAGAPSVNSAGPAAAAAGSAYTVRVNDTLWKIASGLKPGSMREVNRMMLALYRANPEAFAGNVNRLRAGAILRIPDSVAFDAVSAGEAGAEVQRQYAAWRAGHGPAAASAGNEPARLRLVTPKGHDQGQNVSPTAAAGAATVSKKTPTSADTQALRDRVQDLEGQLAESHRLMEVRDAELARLQKQLAATQPVAVTPPAAASPAAPTSAEKPPAGPSETPAQTAAQRPTPPAPTAAVPPKATATETVRPQPPGPSLFDWLLENWYFPAAALLILGGVIFALVRRRQEPDFGELGELATGGGTETLQAEPHFGRESTATLRAPKPDESFLVEESGEQQQLKAVKPPAAVKPAEQPRPEPARAKTADDTLSSETAINLDQGDPLAEADFHMAYGLYDQAADLVRIAIERAPERRDLQLKLLEIFFVWGNRDAFLQTARDLHQSGSAAPAGEWDKIVIMGKQICPDDPLFAQASAGGGSASEVDLNLEGGASRIDLDVLGGLPGDEPGAGIDLDLGEAGTPVTRDPTSQTVALKEDTGLDFVLDDEPGAGSPGSDSSATTREMAARTQESPTVESAKYQPSRFGTAADVPTVESPVLRDRASSTIKEKIDSALIRKDSLSSEQTAELALDDLGLDVGSLDALEQTDHSRAELEETDHPGEAAAGASTSASMVAGLDEKSRRMLEEAAQAGDHDRTVTAGALRPQDQSPTGTWILDDKTVAATMALPEAHFRDVGATARRVQSGGAAPSVDHDSTSEFKHPTADEMDLDLDRLEAALASDTAKQPRPGSSMEERFSDDVFSSSQDLASSGLDLDVSEAQRSHDLEPTHTERIPAEDMELPELEPVTMSEVGTKLDLARAYMDMGDPEGARSILEEVLQEGSATQKQEAQRLIESLPG
jgi:pilus assembly protein FimV